MGWGGNKGKGKGKGKGNAETQADRPDTKFSKKLVTMLRCGEWWEEPGREMDEQGYADLEWVRRGEDVGRCEQSSSSPAADCAPRRRVACARRGR